MYDDSSLGDTYTPLSTQAPWTSSMREALNKPATSTPKSPQTKAKGHTGIKVKPATFDGTGSWKDYRAHFDVVAELKGWPPTEKGLYLAVG